MISPCFTSIPLFFPLLSDLLPPSLYSHVRGLAMDLGMLWVQHHVSAQSTGQLSPEWERTSGWECLDYAPAQVPRGKRAQNCRGKIKKKTQKKEKSQIIYSTFYSGTCTSPKCPLVKPWQSCWAQLPRRSCIRALPRLAVTEMCFLLMNFPSIWDSIAL